MNRQGLAVTDGHESQEKFPVLPEEGAEETSAASSMLEFDNSGFATSSPENDTIFIGMGGGSSGYLGLFAGQGAEDDEGEHRLNNGFIVEVDPSPEPADLAGRWALMGMEWGGGDGGDGWNTGNEEYKLKTTLGIIEFDGSDGITWNFTSKDVITQAIDT